MSESIDRCPHCGFELDDWDVYELLLAKHGGDKERALEDAKEFGWTEENKKRFSKKIGCYDLEKDRTTHYICPSCKEKLDE